MNNGLSFTPLEEAEAALLGGRVVEAGRVYRLWRRGSRGARDADSRLRGQLLAAHLDLLAGRLRAAGMRLRALAVGAPPALTVPLEAGYLLLCGAAAEAIALLDAALEAEGREGDLSLRSALFRQRGLARLEAADLLGACADLAEAERIAVIADDPEAAAAARIDAAESLLALGDSEAALNSLPPRRSLGGELLVRARTVTLLAGGDSSRAPRIDFSYVPSTLAEAGLLLAAAGVKASDGEGDRALEALAKLEGSGWCEAVESCRAEAGLLRASLLLDEGRPEEAFTALDGLEKSLSPGAAGRFAAGADWLRMRASLSTGESAAALRSGRRVLRALERQRAGLFSVEQLRRLSGGHAELYRALISLELRRGSAEGAYAALQQFSARALLRRASPVGATEEKLGRAGGGEHPGRWPIRKALRRLASRRPEALRWRQLISVLKQLGSEQSEKQPGNQ